MRLTLGHQTVIEIEPGRISYVGPDGLVPLDLARLQSGTSLPKETLAKAKPAFKKIRYAGSEE